MALVVILTLPGWARSDGSAFYYASTGSTGIFNIQVWHVDCATGSDENDGKSRQTAFATVQKGIDEANDSDTVLVWPGVYTQPLDFKGKAITVKSAADAAIIQTPGDYAVNFFTAEQPDSVLKNFVLTNSDTAVFIAGTSPTLTNLTIVNNYYGIDAYEPTNPVISNCIFWNNTEGDLFGCTSQYSWLQDTTSPTSGLVAHWAFDEGTGSTAYDSAGNNDGNIYGATWATGQIGGALSFDGINNYVGLPDNDPIWLPQNDFTVSTWVYFDNDPGIANELIIDLDFTYWTDQNLCSGSAIRRYKENGKVGFQMETTTTTELLYTDDTQLKNRWYHIVGVRFGTTQSIYIDGQLNTTRICSNAPIKFSGQCDDKKVNFGKAYDGCWTTGTYYLDGKIDDVRIYNRALSAEEIEQLYTLGTSPDPLFADPNNGDYHLKSQRGRYWPEHNIWVLDDATSPCIDAGDPTIEPSEERMPNGGRINMGAYGGTAYASMSEWPITGDVNHDGRVDFLDFAILAEDWLEATDWAQ